MNQPTEIILERQITRANGTVEPNEVVAYWHEDPAERERMAASVRGTIAVSRRPGRIRRLFTRTRGR